MSRSIAVVIATYGDREKWEGFAKRALKSIREQVTKPDEVIRSHGRTLSIARNAGAAQATTDLIQFVDADDADHPECIGAFKEADPSADILQPAIQSPWIGGAWTEPSVWNPCALETGNYLHIGCAVRRELFLEYGGFDDYDALEDWALWWKLALHGAKIVPCPRAIYRVMGSGSTGRNSHPEATDRALDAIVRRFGPIASGTAAVLPKRIGRRSSMTGTIAYVGNFEPRHSTENHVARTLEEDLGWTVLRLQENAMTTSEIFERTMRASARLLLYTRTWGMNGDGMQLLRDLHAHGVPTASYHLDLYWKGDGKFLESRAESQEGLASPFWQTKYVFSADGGSDDNFRLAGVNHKWIRPGVFRQECYLAEPDPQFTCDVAFVGAMDEYHAEWLPYRQELRAHLVAWFGDRFRNFPGRGQPAIRNEDLNRLYASAKVCVGDSLCPGFNHPRYWSDRLTETLGRGGFLIHPRIEGITDELIDGQHLVLFDFNDWDTLKQRIDAALADEPRRLQIRNAGHEFVKANCTYTNRLREMLQHIAVAEGWPDG